MKRGHFVWLTFHMKRKKKVIIIKASRPGFSCFFVFVKKY